MKYNNKVKYSSVSFDLDSWWALLDIVGHEAPKKNDFVIKESIPRILRLLRKYRMKATFFCIGPDVKNFTLLYKEIVQEGHEIANHTYSHFHHLKDKPKKVIEQEIKKCHEIIQDKLGVTPVGFRAPNYSLSEEILKILQRMSYMYDSSVCPAFYPQIFPLKWVFAPKAPYNPSLKDLTKVGSAKIMEIPLAVSPVKLPLVGTSVSMLGKWWLLANAPFLDFININFHARDAVPKLPYVNGVPKVVYANHEQVLNKLDFSLWYLSKKTQPILLRDAASLYREQGTLENEEMNE